MGSPEAKAACSPPNSKQGTGKNERGAIGGAEKTPFHTAPEPKKRSERAAFALRCCSGCSSARRTKGSAALSCSGLKPGAGKGQKPASQQPGFRTLSNPADEKFKGATWKKTRAFLSLGHQKISLGALGWFGWEIFYSVKSE